MYKLPDMGLEDPVFAVYDIKIPVMSGLVKGKEKKLRGKIAFPLSYLWQRQ